MQKFEEWTLTMTTIRHIFSLLLLIMMLLGCGCSHKTVNQSASMTALGRNILSRVKSKDQRSVALIKEAETWVGTPYRYGGAEKGRGCDCSGFVMSVYNRALGMKIPRNSALQQEFCKPIERREVRAGDLVFFAIGSDSLKINHVGMMVNEDEFLHASQSKGVILSNLQNLYYSKRFRSFGRP